MNRLVCMGVRSKLGCFRCIVMLYPRHLQVTKLRCLPGNWEMLGLCGWKPKTWVIILYSTFFCFNICFYGWDPVRAPAWGWKLTWLYGCRLVLSRCSLVVCFTPRLLWVTWSKCPHGIGYVLDCMGVDPNQTNKPEQQHNTCLYI